LRSIAVALFVAAVAPPLFTALGFPLASLATRQFFALACHQDPARSFWLFGAPLAVCTRCFGIYAGAALASFTLAPRRVRAFFLAALLANAIDVLAESATHANVEALRFTLGFALGASAIALIRRDVALRRLIAADLRA
jgi:uncharacterized membrane protein